MDKALLARVERQGWIHRYPRGWPLLMFFLTVAGTVLSVLAIEQSESQRRHLEIERDLSEIASGIEQRGAEHVAVLRAAGALFTANARVTHAEFTEFANGVYPKGDFRGSLGLGWIRWLDAGSVPAFEASMHSRGHPDFAVRPVPVPGSYVAPIVHLEPHTTANTAAIGFDMYSEAVRRRAMDAAVRLAQPVASGRVRLSQDAGRNNAPAFLIFMPVFQSVEGRRSVGGFVYIPLRAEQFLQSATGPMGGRNVEISLFDGSADPGHLLAKHRVNGQNALSLDRRIWFGQREWILRVSHKEPQALTQVSRITLVFGLVLALLVTVIVRQITRGAGEDRQVLEWLTRQASIRDSLTRELNHRVKNTLANVLSIIALTRRRANGLDEFAESIVGRIRALSATHDLLSQSDWSNALVAEILHSELAPYYQSDGEGSVVEMSGPDLSLAPNDALSLGMAIHELATNAAKYGALSTPGGKVVLEWHLVTANILEVNWHESNGPPVTPPSKSGFGRDLIEKIVAHELRTKVDLRFDPEGVRCTLRIPVRKHAEFSLRSRQASPAAAS